jgi:hypothetical protein
MSTYSKKYRKIMALILTVIFLAACGSDGNGAASAIEAYIQALGTKDTHQISVLSCANWEQNALIEIDSLASVGTQVEDLECQERGTEGEDTLVDCTGIIALDYDGEIQQIDLSNRTYIAHEEGGEWLMCGYK